MTPLLEAIGLIKSYGGVQAVSGVSFSVASGEIVALIGPNGAGKSTCFNMLNGQIRPDSGEARLAGEKITGCAPREIFRLGVGRTFQIAATFTSMTVGENVELVRLSRLRKLGRLFGAVVPSKEGAEDALKLVGMADQRERPCAELAYGDLKRLELAMALAGEPRLLLMDEPTAGMSPGDRIELMALIAGIARARNLGVLFTEHDMDVVFRHADRILVLSRGRLIAEGSPEAVRADPQVKSAYLGEGLTYRQAAAS